VGYYALSGYTVLVLAGLTLAQIRQAKPAADSAHHLLACDDSATPGKKPLDANCAILVHTHFAFLPKEPIVLRLENFSTTEAAHRTASPASAVVEAAGKVWLLTLGSKGERSQSGTLVKEIGPIPSIPTAQNYELFVAEADFSPEMNSGCRRLYTHIQIAPQS